MVAEAVRRFQAIALNRLNPSTEAAVQVGVPWSFRFVSSSGSSANSLTVDANLIQSSGGTSAAAIQVQGACVSPALASESLTGTLGNAASLTVTYGGVNMLLT